MQVGVRSTVDNTIYTLDDRRFYEVKNCKALVVEIEDSDEEDVIDMADVGLIYGDYGRELRDVLNHLVVKNRVEELCKSETVPQNLVNSDAV